MEILLTIIIPGYGEKEYADRLLCELNHQITKEVEVILVDDGNEIPFKYDYYWLKTIRLNKNSGGASVPRNVGLDAAKGKYIAFIDLDDIIKPNYIEKILKKINTEDFDYCFIGWQSPSFSVIIDDKPPEWNMCIWNCIYKKEIIGNERFNPEIIIGEDYDFNVRVRKGKRTSIKEYLYYYNDTPNSLIKRMSGGK